MATQFQNAFSDNTLKSLVTFLVLAMPVSAAQRETQVALAAALFALPFILFSMLGGWLADRFSKQQVLSCVKAAEIGIMGVATLGLAMHSLPLQLGSVFLMGCHSAIFGPSKYGILPEVLPVERISWGNGILELLTFLGIILGTLAGGFFASWFAATPWVAGACLMGLAVVGWACSRGILKVPAADPGCALRVNPISDFGRQLGVMRLDRDLWRANWGNTGFFFIAALVQMNLVVFGHDVLGLSEKQNSSLNAALAIGIGLGSVLAGYASRGRIEYRLVPLGGVVIGLSTVPMGMAGVGTAWFAVALVALGLGAGLFIVPIASVLQQRPAPEQKGAVQGAASLMSFMGILGASGAQKALRWAGLDAGQVFWACGVVSVAVGVYVAWSRRDAMRGIPASNRGEPEGR
ncbi:MAG: hypothetical protein RLZZ244_685 [Verrucomicrobiota bacterium]